MESVDREPSEALDLHPRAGSARFIPRLGQSQQRLRPLLAERGVTLTAAPLYYMQHNPELALFAPPGTSLGQALDPCTHQRQWPHAQRSRAFRGLPFGGVGAPFDPDRDPISESEFATLATQPLDMERSYGATILLPAFHLTGAVGSRGRELDLQLAEAAIAHFRQQRMEEPADDAVVPVRRELYAVIAVRRELLHSPHELRQLADAYLDLAAHGFWVKLQGFDEKASMAEIRAGGGFLRLLGEDSRAVVSCGPGQLHPGLLANEISSSVGIAEAERFRPAAPREAAEARSSQRRSRIAYHPKYLRSFMVGREAAARAFRTSGCSCGGHAPRRVPDGTEVERHCAVARALEARDALGGEVADRREWLLALAAMASHLAHDAGVDHTPRVIFEALFDGIDGLDVQLELTG